MISWLGVENEKQIHLILALSPHPNKVKGFAFSISSFIQTKKKRWMWKFLVPFLCFKHAPVIYSTYLKLPNNLIFFFGRSFLVEIFLAKVRVALSGEAKASPG